MSNARWDFPQYQNLPNEIKLMIWDNFYKGIWEGGAHRFQLSPDPEDPTKLSVKPDKRKHDDASWWRHRISVCCVDEFSWDRLLQFEHPNGYFYQATNHRGRIRAERADRAAVGKDDLTTFRFHFGTTQASLALLSVEKNREVFSKIANIGVEYGFAQRGWLHTKRYKPFTCPCAGNVHSPRPCDPGFVNFIRFFKNLRAFFYICPVTVDRFIYGPALLSYCAEAQGLHRFRDRSGAYCEVHPNQARGILRPDILEVAARLEREWRVYKRTNRAENVRWNPIKFGVLVYFDLRGVTV
ncbi:hypothetical protein O1611_g4597 [Lasiodiplodia mahajangana]|uniref:Uncharacterized protein n=1 Tax=Lasiodiplodia mahajangana TaxID=1108764 RepID=A0ACC2JPC7_9PEZI|nr:hypothetical protein O1611_g4597 [Lasiodiplodia mahajangana]